PPLSFVIRPPARPPLFPYTTLFRSDFIPFRSRREEFFAFDEEFLHNIFVEFNTNAGLFGHFHIAVLNDRFFNTGDEVIESRFVEDRKSTRLNSSHVKISYAVFCLKK